MTGDLVIRFSATVNGARRQVDINPEFLPAWAVTCWTVDGTDPTPDQVASIRMHVLNIRELHREFYGTDVLDLDYDADLEDQRVEALWTSPTGPVEERRV